MNATTQKALEKIFIKHKVKLNHLIFSRDEKLKLENRFNKINKIASNNYYNIYLTGYIYSLVDSGIITDNEAWNLKIYYIYKHVPYNPEV